MDISFGGFITQLCPTLCYPTDCTCQAPLSMEFPGQEYWSRLPFPTPQDLLDPGIKPVSPVFKEDSLLSEPPRKVEEYLYSLMKHYYDDD